MFLNLFHPLVIPNISNVKLFVLNTNSFRNIFLSVTVLATLLQNVQFCAHTYQMSLTYSGNV